MRRASRPSARVLLVNRDGAILLFRFDPPDREPFWCTPGGACDPAEDFPDAARRELLEETGIDAAPGREITRRTAEFRTLEGIEVIADERYFLVRTDSVEISTHGHTALEQEHMRSWRWFAPHELADWSETIYPVDLHDMLMQALESAD